MAKFPDTSLKTVDPDISVETTFPDRSLGPLGPVGPEAPKQEHNIFLGTITLFNEKLAHPDGPDGPVGPLGPVAPCLNNNLLTQPSTPWHLGPVQPLGPLGPEGPEGPTLSNTTFSVFRLQQQENIYK